MAQGKGKIVQKKPSGGRSSGAQLKKGRRVIAPKSKAGIAHQTLHKNLSAKINNSIEQQMVTAASAGKLTIMKNVVSDTRPESWSKKNVESKKTPVSSSKK